MLNKKISEKGISLIETIIAMAILVIVITAVVSLVITSLSTSGTNDSKNQATNYAQEGIEIMRDKKTADYDTFTAKSNTSSNYCFGEGNTELTGLVACDELTTTNISGKFLRTIYINSSGRNKSNMLICDSSNPLVISTVSWNDSKCTGSAKCHKVEISTCFTDNSVIPAI